MANNVGSNGEVDDEWVELILNARNMGITIEEIRQFLQQLKTGTSKEWLVESDRNTN